MLSKSLLLKWCIQPAPQLMTHQSSQHGAFNQLLLDPILQKKLLYLKKDVSIFYYLGKELDKSMFHVDDQDIVRTVQNFKSKMSTDCNDLNMSMVKNIIAHIVKPLTHICKVSFNIGIFPNQMKTAKVIPNYKSGEKGVFTDYIPIIFFVAPILKNPGEIIQ